MWRSLWQTTQIKSVCSLSLTSKSVKMYNLLTSDCSSKDVCYMMFYKQWGRIHTQWFALRCFNSSYVANRMWNTAVNSSTYKVRKMFKTKVKNLLESRNSARASKIIFSTLEICDIDSMQLLFCHPSSLPPCVYL